MQTAVIPINAPSRNESRAELYLDTLQELSRQLERAMEAMVAGSLPDFEDCIRQQRTTCARLIPLAGDAGPGVDADLGVRIAAAAELLQTLNKRYSALLAHSSDTVRLFARLFQGYCDPRPGAATIAAGLSTWSCEM